MSGAIIDVPQAHALRVRALIAAFQREFGRVPTGIAEAPGRVNLIGEHVDYNDGLVLPCAINRSVLCAWARVPGKDIRIYSSNYDEHARVDELHRGAPGSWKNFPRGVSFAFRDARHPVEGLNVAMEGDVPQRAGLSSSAAIEVAVAGAFRDAFALPIGDVALARLCQRAEHECVGVQCGIMDQFAATLCGRDHALLIDCRSLSYDAAPLRLDEAGLSIVIANSATPRSLSASGYNDRRRECEAGVAELRRRLHRADLESLRDVTAQELEVALRQGETLPLRRARHVVSEIARVAAAAEALRQRNFEHMGGLMRESHESLRDDYDVSSPELNLLIELASAQEYVVGARLTGAGFGGCTVNLVGADRIDAFARDVIATYRERTGRPARIYITPACDGLRTWRL